MCTNQQKNPKKLMSIGMMCMVIALLGAMLFHPAAQSWRNAAHALTGMLLGISIVLNLWSARMAARQRRRGES